jgi:hypothetical protein
LSWEVFLTLDDVHSEVTGKAEEWGGVMGMEIFVSVFWVYFTSTSLALQFFRLPKIGFGLECVKELPHWVRWAILFVASHC